MLHQDVHLLLLGGHRVVEMNYAGKGLSPLQFAVPREWPEMTVDDVHSVNEAAFEAGLLVPAEIAALILDVAGGHPRLVQFCLEHFHQTHATGRESYLEILCRHPYLRSLLSDLASRPGFAAGFRRHAMQQDLGVSHEFIDDPVVRLLYWKNLVRRAATPRGSRFVWRTEVISTLGKAVFP